MNFLVDGLVGETNQQNLKIIISQKIITNLLEHTVAAFSNVGIVIPLLMGQGILHISFMKASILITFYAKAGKCD